MIIDLIGIVCSLVLGIFWSIVCSEVFDTPQLKVIKSLQCDTEYMREQAVKNNCMLNTDKYNNGTESYIARPFNLTFTIEY